LVSAAAGAAAANLLFWCTGDVCCCNLVLMSAESSVLVTGVHGPCSHLVGAARTAEGIQDLMHAPTLVFVKLACCMSLANPVPTCLQVPIDIIGS